ncbi:MAG TPA: hypothetical protein VIV11_26195, partial [Kofleriaceae bacterium]
MRQLTVCGLLCLVLACSSGKSPDNTAVKEVRVAAASDLAQAFTDVGAAYTKKTGIKTNFNFSSSGLL